MLRRLSSTILLLEMILNKPNRNTNQKAFVKAFSEKHYDHPTAMEIYQYARKKGIKIGLTSIYRILDDDVKEGSVIEIKAGGVVHYDYVRNDHYHFVCDNCGKIIDLQDDQEIIKGLALKNSFHIRSVQGVVIHGLCDDCAEKDKSDEKEAYKCQKK